MSRGISFHHVREHTKGLIKAWWHDDSGQMGIEYVMIIVVGTFTAYQATDMVGGQVNDIFGQITNVLNNLHK